MLTYLCAYLAQFFNIFHVFQYISFRAILAAITSLSICLIFGNNIIQRLSSAQFSQPIREYGPKQHLRKSGTPTMGGILIVFSILISSLMWADVTNKYIIISLFTLCGFAAIGFYDDYLKLILQNHHGLSSKKKYIYQSIIALLALIYLYITSHSINDTTLFIPFSKTIFFNLGIYYIVFAYFVIVGSSNAVNLTDGLDGLAILPVSLVACGMGVFAYVCGHTEMAKYLFLPHINEGGELSILCATLIGSGLGFLWFNAYPAEIFMGDVGSLSLGSVLGIIAVIVKQEFILLIMGGVFVAETLSVIIQVIYFKFTRKRIFLMSPLHHHFELKGWAEPKIIVRFWIITFILVLCGLASLKLR